MEDQEIYDMFARRKPRVDCVVLIRDGDTEFVPRKDIIDWERKQREDALKAGGTVAGIAVAALAATCMVMRVGNPFGWLAVLSSLALIAGGMGLKRVLADG